MRRAISKSSVFDLFLILIGVCVAVFLPFYGGGEDCYVASVFIVWCAAVGFCFFDIYGRAFFLVFLLAFFNFLIGRSVLVALGIFEEVYHYTFWENIQGQRLVLVSIIVLVLAYAVFDRLCFSSISYEDEKYETSAIIKIRNWSLVAFYFSYVFLMITVFFTVMYVMKHGYASIYLDLTPKVNIYVKKIGDVCPYVFYIFLSTFPRKYEAKLPILFYFVYLCSTLLIGARFDFVIGFLILFIYCLLRNRVGFYQERWVNRKHMAALVIFTFAVVIFFSIYNKVRFGDEVVEKRPLKLFTTFFYDQGVSVNINKRIFKYEDQIPRDRYYSLNSCQSFYERNIEGRLLGKSYFNGASEEKALNGSSLADRLAYIMYKDEYLQGFGGGSSYIAEVYLDFGYIGLAVFNVLLAYVLILVRKGFEADFIRFSISMSVFTGLLKLPRARADTFIIKAIDPMLWISIVLIGACLFFSSKKNSKKVFYHGR